MYSEELAVAVRTIAHQAKRLSQLEAELATRPTVADVNAEYTRGRAEGFDAALQTRFAQLESALQVAKDALYNPFEPNNQSQAYHTVCAAMVPKENT